MCGECGNQYEEDLDEEWVRCKGCKQWYHCECLDLSEGAANDRYFVFDSCSLCAEVAEEPESENEEGEEDEDSEESEEEDETED